ncbi:MAG TPA: sigma-54 dependent transcriptional regulator [Rhodocyclaceae bacterium]|nr:sigma-54 dependent transcriptional regulator [Rhodocyclaceae bacterium]
MALCRRHHGHHRNLMSDTILIVEDDETIRLTVSGFLRRFGFRIIMADCGEAGLRLAQTESFSLILLDLRLPDLDGLSVLQRLRAMDNDALVVIMTAFPELSTAVAALRAGAYDYINKPFDLEDLLELIRRALETRRLRREVAWRRTQQPACPADAMIGESAVFKALLEITRKIAAAGRIPVLIRGESGTGKERIANAIHCHSERAEGPWIALNCSALPEGLLESELFGHEKGAFTDARQTKRGLLELADGGTLFLDEIGDLSPTLQPKLLRVLETQSFRRLGGSRELKVDVRFVAATNRNLEEMVAAGQFREDLLYRLNVGTIEMPPLRERPDDIRPLAERFLAEIAPAVRIPQPSLAPDVLPLLQAYRWPGNVRELRNVLERAAILSGGGPISADMLPREISRQARPESQATAEGGELVPLAEIERRYILRVLDEVGGNKSRAAEILGITRLTLRNKIGQGSERRAG